MVLCDPNGGSLPSEIRAGVEAMRSGLGELARPVGIGIHCHNDCELAVANTLEGVAAGADMVQGTINGYGERCGNANLVSVVANLVLKLGIEALQSESLGRATDLSRTVAEIANLALPLQQPYLGYGAFAQQGGQPVAAVRKHSDAYQHIDPRQTVNEPHALAPDRCAASHLSPPDPESCPLSRPVGLPANCHQRDRGKGSGRVGEYS